MKKVLISLMFIGTIGVMSYTLTRAYFSDKESVKGSRFTAGTLDLQVGGADGSGSAPIEISGIGEIADTGSSTYNIKNTGSLPGQLSLILDNIVNIENGCNDPESKVDTTCANPGQGEGDLGKSIKATFYLDNVKITETTLDITDRDLLAGISPAITMAPGQESQFRLDWQAVDYGNEVQSDSLNLDLNFSLKQIIK